MIKHLLSLVVFVAFAMLADTSLAKRTSVRSDPVFPGGPTYKKVVEQVAGHVFPRSATWNGLGVKRTKLDAERVERDGNSWWLTVRATYKDTTGTLSERVKVHYDNGHVRLDIGELKGVINTKFLENVVQVRGVVNFAYGENPNTGPQRGHIFRIENQYRSSKGFHAYLDVHPRRNQNGVYVSDGRRGTRWRILRTNGYFRIINEYRDQENYADELDIHGEEEKNGLYMSAGGRGTLWKIENIGRGVYTVQNVVRSERGYPAWLDVFPDEENVELEVSTGGRGTRWIIYRD